MDIFESLWSDESYHVEEQSLGECLKTKSATYKIVQGTFMNPFSSDSEDEREEQERQKQEQQRQEQLIKNQLKKLNKKKENVVETVKSCGEVLSEDGVPYSSLSAKQHVAYMDVLRAIQSKDEIKLPLGFMALKEAVKKEQGQFLEYIETKWQTSYEKHHIILDDASKFIGDIWKSHLRRVLSYPRFYKPYKMIPLVSSLEKPKFELMPVQVLLEMGIVPKLCLPKKKVKSTICTDYSKMCIMNASSPKDYGTIQQLPVNQDKNAEMLALRHKAHIVISSSAIKCIANNVPPTYEREWQIPVVVKEYYIKDGRTYKFQKVVYIDKKLPPKNMTAMEKNMWYHKFALKLGMCNSHDPGALRYPEYDMNPEVESSGSFIPEGSLCEAIQLCEHCELFLKEVSKDGKNECDSFESDSLMIVDHEDSHQDLIQNHLSPKPQTSSKSSNSGVCTCGKNLKAVYKGKEFLLVKIDKNKEHRTIVPPASKTNVTYRLWKLFPERRCKEDLSKSFLKHQSTPQEINVLIRCKMDACNEEGKKVAPVTLSSKLEYQPEYGAEKLSLSHLINEWTSLLIRPEAVLARVRVNALNEEIYMTEVLRIHDISQYAVVEYTYPIRSNILQSLYCVFSSLITERPGIYMLSHNSRNGAFISLLQEGQDSESTQDLHADYSSVNAEAVEKAGVPIWTPIDSAIITPAFLESNRIPATFEPMNLPSKGPDSSKKQPLNVKD